jgi:hypothetical protein
MFYHCWNGWFWQVNIRICNLKSLLKISSLENNYFPFIINLDPAVHYLPYTPDLDIRTIVDYKKTME